MSREQRDAERAARRARRLAERADERARKAERHAQRAAERAERLDAEKTGNRSTGRRTRDDGQSFEDMVDDFAERAERWFEEQTRDWSDPGDERELRRAEREAKRAREQADQARANANRASRAAEDLADFSDDIHHDFMADTEQPRRYYRHHKSSSKRRWDRWRKRRRTAHLYRDKERGKFLGVCAGIAGYFGRAPWEIRLYTILGLMFIPSIIVPAYFICYFIMDDKPYYRRVTDRFDESPDTEDDDYDDEPRTDRKKRMNRHRKVSGAEPALDPAMDNVQAMKTARDKFSDIEQRLRNMESHVTSSRFELQREFRKIAGEEA